MDGLISGSFSTFGMSTGFCLSTCSGEVAVDVVENSGNAECSEVDTVTLGAIIIASPDKGAFNYAVIFPFLAALCFAFFTISTKFLNTSDSNQTTLLFTAITGTILSLPFIIYFWKWPNLNDTILMFCLGLLATMGHFLFIEALKVISASFAAPFVYLTVLLAAFWGYILYNEIPNQNTFIGAFLIIISGFIITHINKKNVK